MCFLDFLYNGSQFWGLFRLAKEVFRCDSHVKGLRSNSNPYTEYVY